MDPRSTPANTRVAAPNLKGKVSAPLFVEGAARRVLAPLVDLLAAPQGRRERQLLTGDRVNVFEIHEGWAFVQAEKDGFVGYVPQEALGEDAPVSHWVSSPATHVYPAADLKLKERATLSLGAHVLVINEDEKFAETPLGFIPRQHLTPLSEPAGDLVALAASFLGTPYLWGGNSHAGIDCSGLVQVACLACGINCPGDSDQQMEQLGEKLSEDAPLKRGDLLFWKGHVAWVFDSETILHANAHHMSVAFEGLGEAITRIAPESVVLARKRLKELG